MHVDLHPRFIGTDRGERAQALTSACVHCGFCLTACPTYLDRRDERDSPRGRIYLIKQALEEGTASAVTQQHLDRCLTCRNCETACPSGMQYGKLLDIGRELLEEEAPRPARERWQRGAIRFLFARPRLLQPLFVIGRLFRPLLPGALARKLPPAQQAGPRPATAHTRRMLLLEGCVQQAATPLTNAAAARVLDRLGINLESVSAAGCCGALDHHLSAQDAALARMRGNIDAWWPRIEEGAEAIVASASGCGAQLADYGHLLAHDPAYADKAARISDMTRDLAQVIAAEDIGALRADTSIGRVAVHTPCTLRNALGEPNIINSLLARAGFDLVEGADTGLCCGSAGTYSLLQADTSERLRERSLKQLTEGAPDLVVTANIGCQLHLASDGPPVRHWIELLDAS